MSRLFSERSDRINLPSCICTAVGEFSCIDGCSDCCEKRQYYPSEPFGKIGVLLLPDEKKQIESHAARLGIRAKILPRIAVGQDHDNVIAYQLMGSRDDGDYCPFLDSSKKSPHAGAFCRIYAERPLACRAYPVLDQQQERAQLDEHCRFCSAHGNSVSSAGLEAELEALAKIKSRVRAEPDQPVWRYATATGSGARLLPEGWIRES